MTDLSPRLYVKAHNVPAASCSVVISLRYSQQCQSRYRGLVDEITPSKQRMLVLAVHVDHELNYERRDATSNRMAGRFCRRQETKSLAEQVSSWPCRELLVTVRCCRDRILWALKTEAAVSSLVAGSTVPQHCCRIQRNCASCPGRVDFGIAKPMLLTQSGLDRMQMK